MSGLPLRPLPAGGDHGGRDRRDGWTRIRRRRLTRPGPNSGWSRPSAAAALSDGIAGLWVWWYAPPEHRRRERTRLRRGGIRGLGPVPEQRRRFLVFLWLILALAWLAGARHRLAAGAARGAAGAAARAEGRGLRRPLVALPLDTAPPSSASTRVAHVADGDTVTAITGRGPVRVRLLGIDAPELTDTRFGYPTCGRPIHLRALAPPRTVRLITDPESGDTRDAHHRFAGLRRRPARRPREAQLAAGEAIVYRYHDPRFSRLGAYERAEQVTRAHDRGAWRECHGDLRRPVR